MRQVVVKLADADAGAGGRAALRFMGVDAPPVPNLTLAVWNTDPANPWLGPQGWQATEHRFRPESAVAEGQDLVLIVGREVVDNIADYTVVDVQLPEQGLRGTVSWQDVTRSYAPDPKAGARERKVTDTHSPAPPPPLPVLQEEPVRPPPVPEPPAPINEPTPEPPPVPAPKPRRRLLWPIAAAVLLLAVGLGGGYWWYSQPQQQTAPLPPRERTPEELLADAKAAINAGEIETARPILRRLDAQHYAPGQAYWAELIDSVDFRPGLLREPDDLRAVDLYAAACAGGVAEAKDRLAQLAQSLETRASSGDGLASELLRGPLRDIRDKCR